MKMPNKIDTDDNGAFMSRYRKSTSCLPIQHYLLDSHDLATQNFVYPHSIPHPTKTDFSPYIVLVCVVLVLI